jgi:DNA-binding NarL/FixJ family response regulator
MGNSEPHQVSVVVVTNDRVTGEALACACERRGATATVREPRGTISVDAEVVVLDLTSRRPTLGDWSTVTASATRTVALGGSPSLVPINTTVNRWVADDRSLDDLLAAILEPDGPERAAPVDVARSDGSVGSLTVRERQVLVALLAGDGVQGIAERFGIAENTVRTHLQNLFAKLGVRSRAEAAAYALRHGLVDDHRRVG